MFRRRHRVAWLTSTLSLLDVFYIHANTYGNQGPVRILGCLQKRDAKCHAFQ